MEQPFEQNQQRIQAEVLVSIRRLVLDAVEHSSGILDLVDYSPEHLRFLLKLLPLLNIGGSIWEFEQDQYIEFECKTIRLSSLKISPKERLEIVQQLSRQFPGVSIIDSPGEDQKIREKVLKNRLAEAIASAIDKKSQTMDLKDCFENELLDIHTFLELFLTQLDGRCLDHLEAVIFPDFSCSNADRRKFLWQVQQHVPGVLLQFNSALKGIRQHEGSVLDVSMSGANDDDKELIGELLINNSYETILLPVIYEKDSDFLEMLRTIAPEIRFVFLAPEALLERLAPSTVTSVSETPVQRQISDETEERAINVITKTILVGCCEQSSVLDLSFCFPSFANAIASVFSKHKKDQFWDFGPMGKLACPFKTILFQESFATSEHEELLKHIRAYIPGVSIVFNQSYEQEIFEQLKQAVDPSWNNSVLDLSAEYEGYSIDAVINRVMDSKTPITKIILSSSHDKTETITSAIRDMFPFISIEYRQGRLLSERDDRIESEHPDTKKKKVEEIIKTDEIQIEDFADSSLLFDVGMDFDIKRKSALDPISELLSDPLLQCSLQEINRDLERMACDESKKRKLPFNEESTNKRKSNLSTISFFEAPKPEKETLEYAEPSAPDCNYALYLMSSKKLTKDEQQLVNRAAILLAEREKKCVDDTKESNQPQPNQTI